MSEPGRSEPGRSEAGRCRHLIRTVLTAPFAARTWRELGYVGTGLLFAVPVFVLALLAVVFSVVSLLTIGLPFLVAILLLGRLSVRWFRAPARLFLRWDWPAPAPIRPRTLGALLRDGTAWKALAYGFLRLPLNAVTVYAAVVGVGLGVASLTYPLWWFLSPTLAGALDETSWTGTLLPCFEGLAAVLLVPWWLRLLVGVDRLLAYALLAPSPERARIAALESSRASLRADAEARLRSVERDLHDGTQARLVALGVTLSRVHRRITDEPVKALVEQARGDVTAALGELRDIVRGLHPPALDDGLDVALRTLCSRSGVPVRVTMTLPAEPPAATATAVYFIVAELLTNAARHAAATVVDVDLRHDGHWLRLAVSDDGRGGASLAGGTGLRGLARRAEALDGTFDLTSPIGGPTRVVVCIPMS